MAISAAQAREVMRARVGDLPTGHHVDVRPVGPDAILWLANCVDANEMPYAGAATIIGPDEKVWVLSSNPAIHDLDVGLQLLEGVYGSELQELLDPEGNMHNV